MAIRSSKISGASGFDLLNDSAPSQLPLLSAFPDQNTPLDMWRIAAADELATGQGAASSTIESFRMAADGSRFYVLYVGGQSGVLVEYQTATAHRIEGGKAVNVLDVSYDNAIGVSYGPVDFEFSQDGLQIFFLHTRFSSFNRAYLGKVDLSAAWDLGSAGALAPANIEVGQASSNEGPFNAIRWMAGGKVMVLKTRGSSERLFARRYTTAYDYTSSALDTHEIAARGRSRLAADYVNNFVYQYEPNRFRRAAVADVNGSGMLVEDAQQVNFNKPTDIPDAFYLPMLLEFVEGGNHLYEFGRGDNSDTYSGNPGSDLVGRLISCSPAYDLSIPSGNRDFPTPPEFQFHKQHYNDPSTKCLLRYNENRHSRSFRSIMG
ncbi:MAG: hypothetical protein AAF556_07945, partial [Pseudomonadota bacterium]